MQKKNLYKVIEEYDRFYLGILENGFRECFMKSEYKPDSEGYIHKKTVVEKAQEQKAIKLNKETIDKILSGEILL